MQRATITEQPIDPATLLQNLGDEGDGAALLFVGNVRRENEGRAVSGMRYDAYQEMAEKVLGEIVEEAINVAGSARIRAIHRIGELTVGETSVAIAVATPHRAQAFDAGRYIIEEIKKRLPVWKQEHYVTGESDWLAGQTPKVAHE